MLCIKFPLLIFIVVIALIMECVIKSILCGKHAWIEADISAVMNQEGRYEYEEIDKITQQISV